MTLPSVLFFSHPFCLYIFFCSLIEIACRLNPFICPMSWLWAGGGCVCVSPQDPVPSSPLSRPDSTLERLCVCVIVCHLYSLIPRWWLISFLPKGKIANLGTLHILLMEWICPLVPETIKSKCSPISIAWGILLWRHVWHILNILLTCMWEYLSLCKHLFICAAVVLLCSDDVHAFTTPHVSVRSCKVLGVTSCALCQN